MKFNSKESALLHWTKWVQQGNRAFAIAKLADLLTDLLSDFPLWYSRFMELLADYEHEFLESPPSKSQTSQDFKLSDLSLNTERDFAPSPARFLSAIKNETFVATRSLDVNYALRSLANLIPHATLSVDKGTVDAALQMVAELARFSDEQGAALAIWRACEAYDIRRSQWASKSHDFCSSIEQCLNAPDFIFQAGLLRPTRVGFDRNTKKRGNCFSEEQTARARTLMELSAAAEVALANIFAK